jgi:hypothetical protein
MSYTKYTRNVGVPPRSPQDILDTHREWQAGNPVDPPVRLIGTLVLNETAVGELSRTARTCNLVVSGRQGAPSNPLRGPALSQTQARVISDVLAHFTAAAEEDLRINNCSAETRASLGPLLAYFGVDPVHFAPKPQSNARNAPKAHYSWVAGPGSGVIAHRGPLRKADVEAVDGALIGSPVERGLTAMRTTGEIVAHEGPTPTELVAGTDWFLHVTAAVNFSRMVE